MIFAAHYIFRLAAKKLLQTADCRLECYQSSDSTTTTHTLATKDVPGYHGLSSYTILLPNMSLIH